ncbi:MAG: 50S ribosomal protein L15 [Candidatus Gracilibacteria bacterium]|jgi:large subunit ribosomal protein L15|nr:50S ribosomal protein L15 [Candidatus Gracilibacteria bacterium]
MSLLELRSKANKKRKRIGRGNSAGQGSTSGRGNKGTHQRTGGKISPGFEGGQTPFLRRMPKLKGFKNPGKIAYQVVKTDSLNSFKQDETVNIDSLYEKKLISKKTVPVKLLCGKEKLTVKLNIELHKVSNSALEQVKESGSEFKALQ